MSDDGIEGSELWATAFDVTRVELLANPQGHNTS